MVITIKTKIIIPKHIVSRKGKEIGLEGKKRIFLENKVEGDLGTEAASFNVLGTDGTKFRETAKIIHDSLLSY